MAAFNTQINQIYLTDPKNPKTSLLLFEEEMANGSHLFLVAEITDMIRKSDREDLGRIGDLIITDFRALKKGINGDLFESALSQINQDLASLALKGKRSWLGKFSGIIALRESDSIYLANTGPTMALLKRKSELLEILSSEKKGNHPLKTFTNFTEGKLKLNDQVVLTTSNVVNFVALHRIGEILSEKPQEQAVGEILSVLKDSVDENHSFCGFVFTFGPKTVESEPVPVAETILAVPEEPPAETVLPLALPVREEEHLYAPMTRPKREFKLPKVLAWVKMPAAFPPTPFSRHWSISMPNILYMEKFRQLSFARKFFLICFIIFLLVFAVNVGAFFINQSNKRHQNKITDQASQLSQKLDSAEAAFIIQDEDSAGTQLAEARQIFNSLKNLSPQKAAELEPMLTDVSNKINRTVIISNPRNLYELKNNPQYVARAGSGFIFSAAQASSIFSLNNSTLKNIFLLNSIDSSITGLSNMPGFGNLVATSKKIYRVNESQKQFDTVSTQSNSDLLSLKTLSPNRLYTIDKKTGQVLRFVIADGTVSAAQPLLKSSAPMDGVQDLGIDGDVYLLYSNNLKRFTNGTEANFGLAQLADPLQNAERIFVGSSIYILEPAKKRIIIYSKNGKLTNQLYFPSSNSLTDFYVDENSRYIYLIDGNALLQITF